MEFLILAVVLIAIGVVIVIVRNRRPTGIDAGIADFEARRQALAPTPSPAERDDRDEVDREPEQRGRRSG